MTLTKILVSICLYCLNCTKFGKLFLRKIIKIVATRCQILRLKCIEFDFGWGSAPDPAGELTALPRPPSWIKGGLLLRGGRGKEGKGGDGIGWEWNGREGTGGEIGKGAEGKGKEGTGRERKEEETAGDRRGREWIAPLLKS